MARATGAGADRVFPCALAVVAGLLFALFVAGQLLDIAPGPGVLWPFNTVAAVTFTLMGGLIVPRQPRNSVGWLFVAIGLVSAVVLLSATFSGYRLMAWVNLWSPVVPYGLLPLALLVFPDGRLPSRRWLPIAWIAAIGLCVTAGLFALVTWSVPTSESPLGMALALRVFRAGFWVVIASMAAAAVSLGVRWLRAHGDIRQQLKWLALGTVVVPVGIVLDIAGIPSQELGIVTAMTVPVAGAVAILKYRLYDIDLFLNRSIVYLVLTLLLVAAYVAIVILLGSPRVASPEWVPRAVATGVIAVAFQPLRERVQRGANRLLYGDRADPYAVVSRLGRRLEQALDPAAVLPQVAETVSEALKLPAVAIELIDADGARTVASHGRHVGEVAEVVGSEAFPMAYQGQVVGRLLVTPRSSSHAFTPAERGLLQDLARQAGLAAHAVRLTADLRRSRERLVRSREEERRRLRRDLHDGLGPAMAGMTMQIGAALALLRTDAAAAEGVLGGLERGLRVCVVEVRRLVDDLRPPALDQLGLVQAIRQQTSAFSAAAVQIAVSAPEDLAELPAAVEVAAYRIATEAVTNTVRHAAASRCEVTLTLEAGLVVEVTDNGVGLPDQHRTGVGLKSMRERTEELGGTFAAQRLPHGGTRIRAELPLAA
ncbi:MAG: histidine kinase [Egibacteraceae bacterium]